MIACGRPYGDPQVTRMLETSPAARDACGLGEGLTGPLRAPPTGTDGFLAWAIRAFRMPSATDPWELVHRVETEHAYSQAYPPLGRVDDDSGALFRDTQK